MKRNEKLAACSFSGGKDSTLALWYAMKLGYKVKYLVNFASYKFKRSSFHGLPIKLIELQSISIGIPLLKYLVGRDNRSYEKKFIKMLKKLKSLNIRYLICGDIYLRDHPKWIKEKCEKFGIKLVEPLWGKSTDFLIKSFLNYGFKAKIVSINAQLLPKKFIGKEISLALLRELMKYKVCLCGENGEYHTFVYDGPIFKKKIRILKSEVVYKKTFWSAWFLDIKKYKLEKK